MCKKFKRPIEYTVLTNGLLSDTYISEFNSDSIFVEIINEINRSLIQNMIMPKYVCNNTFTISRYNEMYILRYILRYVPL
jgi:hypothetical protein